MKPPFAGIIFDFNGVLWWDTHLQQRSWREFSTAIRGVPLTEEELALDVHGRNNGHTLAYLTGRLLTAAEIRGMTEQKETIYRQLCLDEGEAFRLSPGAVDLLDWLVAQRIPRTIATASEKTNVDFFVHHLELDNWVEDSLSGIRAAHAAGIGYIIALGPQETHSRLSQEAGVDKVAESLTQLRVQERRRLFAGPGKEMK